MEKQAVFKAPKTMKMFVYVYNTVLLVLGITKEDFKGFLTPKSLLRWFSAFVVMGVLQSYWLIPIMNYYHGS